MTITSNTTSKDVQNLPANNSNSQDQNLASKHSIATPIANLDSLIEAQVSFVQQWLRGQAQALTMQAWQWLGDQPISRYIKSKDLQYLINDWLLAQPMSQIMRSDIRDILHSIIYHPANDTVPLSELIDDTQINTLATYIGGHEQQRSMLIHTLIGNETFADLLTQTLYHAINDFMESTLDKAGGVGKLMKMGRSSFEKATNRSLDEKLQAYLNRNIKDLARRAEANAQEHLSNEEVSRLLIAGWARIKDQPISHIQTYLNADPDNGSIYHLEASVQQSYERLRVAPYLHSLIAVGVETWYHNHQTDTFARLADSLNIDETAIAQLSNALLPLAQDAIDSPWFSAHIREMLQAFYKQATIADSFAFNA